MEIRHLVGDGYAVYQPLISLQSTNVSKTSNQEPRKWVDVLSGDCDKKLNSVVEIHFFNPAVQFNTTVMGSGDESPI